MLDAIRASSASSDCDMDESELNNRLERIRADYMEMVDKVEDENIRDKEEILKRQRRETEEMEMRHSEERRRFELRQSRDKERLIQRQSKQREEVDRRIEVRNTGLRKFVESIHSPASPTLGLHTRREMECPVCLNEMKPPVRIWQCSEGHPVCDSCQKRPQVQQCPTCRRPVTGRNILAEKIAMAVFGEEEPACEIGLQDRDIQMVMVQANATRDLAVKALSNNNNILDAIMELSHRQVGPY